MNETELSPDEAFALLGNETRIGIIRALGTTPAEQLSFSDLRETVGVGDSGQFNYHLNQLLDRFVQRTEDGEYTLTYAGNRVVGAIYSGVFTQEGETEPIALDSTCITCGTGLVARYADESVNIHCPGCDRVDAGFGFPPGGVQDRTNAELTRVFDRWLKSVFALIGDRICYNCTGTMTATITDDSEYLHDEEPACVTFDCTRCPDTADWSVSSYLVTDPEIVNFYASHGIDLQSIDIWNSRTFVDPDLTVRSRDPWEIEATFTVESDSLTVVIDDDLDTRRA